MSLLPPCEGKLPYKEVSYSSHSAESNQYLYGPQSSIGASASVSRYPGKHLFERIKSLENIVMQTLYLTLNVIANMPDETEIWLHNSTEDFSVSDPHRHFLRELISKSKVLFESENSSIDESFRNFVWERMDNVKFLAENLRSQRLPILPVSEDSLTSLGLEELLMRLWRMDKLNNLLLLQWGISMLQWCLQPVPESTPGIIYVTETACKMMYLNVYEVPHLTAKIIRTLSMLTEPHSKNDEINCLMHASSKATSLYISLYSEVRNIKYTLEKIYPPISSIKSEELTRV